MLRNRFLGLVAVVAGFASTAPTASAAFTVALNPKATYLRTSGDGGALTATAIDLQAQGIAVGSRIVLEQVGTFSRGPGFPANDVSLVGVFSGSNVLGASNTQVRVAGGGIATGLPAVMTLDTFSGNLPTDIANDFLIANPSTNGVEVTVAGRYLFLSPNDSRFGDNVSFGYGVRVTEVTPLPPTALMMGGSLLIGVAARLRRRLA